eukprot:c23917_g1_i1 orf=839-3316(-)
MAGSQGDSPIKADGTSSHSDQSSNLSDCSQVLQYFNCTDGLSVSASLMPAIGLGEGNQVLMNAANLSATSASSLTTGGNSLVSGNSTLQQSMNMKADSVTSTGAASMGLPTSPLSFSSSNVSLPGSSGFSMTSLSHSGMTSMNRLEAPRDPTIHPNKLLKLDNGYPPILSSEEPAKFGWQYDVNNFDVTRQVLGANVGGRFDHQFKGQGLMGPRQDFHSNEQQLAELHASMSAAKAMQNLQQQAAQNRFQRSNPLLSAHLHRHDLLQQQPQHVHPQLLQQRLLQQEHLMRMLPPQLHRSHVLQQQHQLQQQQQLQHMQHQIAGMSKQPDKGSLGSCSRRLMLYMHRQRMRPADNNIGFWREFTLEFFAPLSRKRWCLSQCSTGGRHQPNGIFPQELWCCEICGSSPGRGFEVTVEVMPRLCKSKFDNGELEELLFVDLPHEYRLSSGLIVLEYNKAVQESVYEQLRVVWEGQLRIIFTAELKIVSWDFCAKSHEELLPRRTIIPQANQLVQLASRYQSAMAQSNGNGLSAQDLQAICKLFASSAHQLTNSLEPPCVNELGFTKRFVRCIQIAEVVNSMKDLIDFSRDNHLGPIESLAKYPTSRSSAEVSKFLRQGESIGLDRPGAEENLTSSFVQSKIDDQGNMLSRPISEHVNLLQSRVLQQGSGSLQNFAQIDSATMGTPSTGGGSAVNSLQASPTSSLTSYQTCYSSLTNNCQTPVTSFQNPVTASPGNVNLLQQPSIHQHIQSGDPISGGTVQQFLQGMISSHPRAGQAFGQRSSGSLGMNVRNTEGMIASGLGRSISGLNASIGNASVGGTGAISETRQQ